MHLFLLSMLTCPKKTCCTANAGFTVNVTEQAEDDAPEYNIDVIRKAAGRMDYSMFYGMIGHAVEGLPPELPDDYDSNQEFLTVLAYTLYGLIILEGTLTCNSCGLVFPITEGVPRMRLPEEDADEFIGNQP
ncbi:Putative Trm112 family protein [Giardia duodenalis]|nr:Putative Trm112 family protein [Giardia intestinalis]